VFNWLRMHAPAAPGGHEGDEISWNFNKFLVDKQGHVVKRYTSDISPGALEHDVYDQLIRDKPGSEGHATT